MAFDIFGERLERGHCEVHPWVHQAYPCSVCLLELQQSSNDPQHDYMQAHLEALQSENNALKESIRELIQAMKDYEMEVDSDAPLKHRMMMEKARKALGGQTND